MPRSPENKRAKKKEASFEESVGQYLKDSLDESAASSNRWEQFKTRFIELLNFIHLKGRSRLMIMVIPHNEKKIFNLHVTLYALASGIAVVLVILAISVVSLVDQSGEDIQFYDMGMTNSQFNLQSIRMAEESIPLHETIRKYTGTIAEMHARLTENSENFAKGGAAVEVIDKELNNLRTTVEECKELGDDCDQKQTEEILQRVLFLSRQDNENLKQSIQLSEEIIEKLKTDEMQNLLENTPNLWPTEGYIKTPYGSQTDAMIGKPVFKQGIEIATYPGSAVVATAPGKVTEINYSDTYGLYVWIEHPFGMKTFYGHLDRVDVREGDRLKKGHKLGLAGRTGAASTTMVYYELHVGTVAYNPGAFLNYLQEQWLNPQNH